MLTNLIIGAGFGLLFVVPYLKAPTKSLALMGYVSLAMMLMIYLGAHLVSSDFTRLSYETAFAVIVLGFAGWFRKSWPLGVALLVLAHGAYDHFYGHASGVADWYPAVCVGFDVVVGLGLAVLILRNGKSLSRA